jgi:hypothetical protein
VVRQERNRRFAQSAVQRHCIHGFLLLFRCARETL